MMKSNVDKVEEALMAYPPGSRISFDELERVVRSRTGLYLRYKIQGIIKSLVARGTIDLNEGDTLTLWPKKLNKA
jgi:hypothetical protein